MYSAYSKGITKTEFVREMKWHYDQDRFIKGTYEEYFGKDGQFKGCAVGCGVNSINKLKGLEIEHDNHEALAKQLDIPLWLAYLQDVLFEGLPKELSDKFPLQFAKAINKGANLETIKIPILIYVLEGNIETLNGIREQTDIVKQSSAVNRQMIEALKSGNKEQIQAAKAAAKSARAAWSAAEAAGEAAWSSAEAVWSSESATYEKLAKELLRLMKECK